MPDYAPGTPSWIDLGSPDVDASIRFYGDLFGWSASEAGPPEAGGYRFFLQDGKMVAGLGPLMMEGQPPAWLSYVTVADADETAAKARDAGGMVHVEPMDVLDVGRMAVIADPTGAALGLWQPRRHTGAEIVNEPVSLAWNELNTRDTDAAKPFYEAIFGWQGDTAQMGDIEYTTWQLGDKPVGGMIAMSEQVPAQVPAHWLAYFAVTDTDATMEKAKAGGGNVMFGPTDVPAGRFAVLADPHGAIFGVIKLS
jgi:predicted enzyme related to lactoylglutathione lyase